MGSKRVGAYRNKSSSHNKKRNRSLQGRVAAHVVAEAAPTKIDPIYKREDEGETSYGEGVESDFPSLCSDCDAKAIPNPPTDDDWHQARILLTRVDHKLDEKGLDSLCLGMKLMLAESKRAMIGI